MKKTNEQYKLTIQSPLLRPGLTLTITSFSKKYAVDIVRDAMEIVREINKEEQS
jgi:hypothetical protein